MKNTTEHQIDTSLRTNGRRAAALGRSVLAALGNIAETPKLKRTLSPDKKTAVDIRLEIERTEWSGRPLI